MTRYELNAPDATFEDCDGEIIVINLASGNYYSLRGAICLFWNELISGRSIAQIITQVTQSFTVPEEDVRQSVEKVVDQLVAEKILRAAAIEAPTGEFKLSSSSDKFEAPSIERYDDMQDLLLLDPVHEVDVTGWPQRPDSETKD